MKKFLFFLSFVYFFFILIPNSFAYGVAQPNEIASCSAGQSAVCATYNNNCGFYAANYPAQYTRPGVLHDEWGYICQVNLTCRSGWTLSQGVCAPPPCEGGVPNNPDGSCPASSSSSSSSSSSAPVCTTTQYFDPLLNSCAELVENASDCGSEDYALQSSGGFACYTEQPDNTHCLANIIVTPTGTTTVYSCTTSTNSNSSSSSGSNTSSGSGSASSSGSNSSASPQQQVLENCELTFGVGNCQQNTTSTPCPNSYKQNGITYCVTTSGGGSSSSSGSGSGSSASSGAGSGSSASSGNATASNCSSEPVCTGGDPIQCAFLKQVWINNCDGIEKKIDIDANTDNANIQSEFNDLIDNNQTDLNSDGTIAGVTGEIDVSQYVDMVSNLNNAASQASSGSCPAPRTLDISSGSQVLTYQPMCDLAEGMSYFVLLFFSITGSLIIYRTVERI